MYTGMWLLNNYKIMCDVCYTKMYDVRLQLCAYETMCMHVCVDEAIGGMNSCV